MAYQASRQRDLFKELGLTGNELICSSSSEEDNEVLSNEDFEINSMVEVSELKKLLKETQGELRYAQGSLALSESGKERKVNILRKTHQSAISMKQKLIRELQDIISEKDEYVSQLEAKLAGKELDIVKPGENGFKRIVDQFCKLGKDFTNLQSQHEQTLEDLRLKQLNNDDLPNHTFKQSKPAMIEDIKKMQQKLTSLEKDRIDALSLYNANQTLQKEKIELERRLQDSEEMLYALKNEDKEVQVCHNCTSLMDQITSLDEQLLFEREKNTLDCDQLKQEKILLISECSNLKVMLHESAERIEQLLEDIDNLKQTHLAPPVQPIISQKKATLNMTVYASEIKRCIECSKDHIEHLNAFMKIQFTQASLKLCRVIDQVCKQRESLRDKYLLEMKRRKKLYNQVVELKGNIRVFCRVRPKITEDGCGQDADVIVEPDREDSGITHIYSKGAWKKFEVDRTFGPRVSQKEVFDEIEPLVTSCVDGFNVCIIAYGQTGSGKTYTMEGSFHDPGINQRALQELFRKIDIAESDWSYTVTVSMLEIYNDCIHDLLSTSHQNKLEIKLSADGLYIPGLTQVSVSELDDVNMVFSLGRKNRATAATKMNICSSRSHALLNVTVVGHNCINGIKTTGKLNLIDLAGSERVHKSGSDGARLQEAKHINKSLSSLADVIHCLRLKSRHIPYRNSKLTFLLQDSLGGDSKTLVVVQLSPVEKNLSETLCSLNFAQRLRGVELGPAMKKVL